MHYQKTEIDENRIILFGKLEFYFNFVSTSVTHFPSSLRNLKAQNINNFT